MRRAPVLLLISTVLLAIFSGTLAAQDCAPPAITANAKGNNIFSPEQEMVLGELTYQGMLGETRFVKDPGLTAYINQIGQRLVKHLPPTGLKFQFFIIELPEANAFNIPGGYVFISRKLIGFTHNEDELAGVMAHELGHATVRHGAVQFSEYFRKLLNVTQVGDRKDITEKYNLFLEQRRTKEFSRGSSTREDQQLEADQIGLYAMVAAGYDPNAFESFMERLLETKGKSGNWFSDIFSSPKPDEKRLREMIKISDQLPAQCREHPRAEASQEFLKWQADVVSYRETNKAEELPGLLWKRELTPKLRSDVSHFAFSPDGKYFLAQDDFAITIIERESAAVAFQIPAQDAEDANFTPDGKFVVFGTEGLRHEKWSIAEKKPVQVRELVVRRDCWEHGFSPDGNYLVCFDKGLNLAILDTQTGKKVFQKKEFYKLSFFEYLTWIVADTRTGESDRQRFFHIEFSPDSRLLVVARTNRFRFRFKIDAMTIAQSDNTMLALDLPTLKEIKTSGDLKKVTTRAFLFLDSNKILGMGSTSIDDSGVFSFPEGKRLARFQFGADELKRTANPNFVIFRPLANARIGIYDLSRNTIVSGSNKNDADLWDKYMVYESINGKVLLSETEYDEKKKFLQPKPLTTIDIPVASVGDLTAAELSDNLQWLAVSTKTRGAVWNLESGERKLFIRGFRGALLAADGGGLGDFPNEEPFSHALAFLNPQTHEARTFRDLPETGVKLYRGFLLIRHPLKEKEMKTDDKNRTKEDRDSVNEAALHSEVHFELRNVLNDKVVWSRDFPREAPGFFFDPFSGRLILYWELGTEVGKARLKEDQALAAHAKELGNKDDDYLMEIVDAYAAKTVGTLLIETGKRSFFIRSGSSEGDWLTLQDSTNRILVYSIKNGDLRHRFFGADAATNPGRNQIVVENYPGELTFYDLANGNPQGRLTFSGRVAFARFTLDGKRLFVLSGEQTAYAFDVDKLSMATSVRTQ